MQVDEIHRPGETGDPIGDPQLKVRGASLSVQSTPPDGRADVVAWLSWALFGRTGTLKAAAYCAPVSTVWAGSGCV
jgi:hypothetical protein